MRIFCLVALWVLAPLALADVEACNEMYPADAYEPEERAQYMQDCLAAYGEGDGMVEAPIEQEPAYNDYQGSVDDYVQTLPEPETEQSEPMVEY